MLKPPCLQWRGLICFKKQCWTLFPHDDYLYSLKCGLEDIDATSYSLLSFAQWQASHHACMHPFWPTCRPKPEATQGTTLWPSESSPSQGRSALLTHEVNLRKEPVMPDSPKVGKEKCKLWLVCETLLSLLSAERSISVCFPTNVLSTNKVYWVITCTNSQWEIRCWNIVLRLESGYALVITLLQS